MRAVVKDIGPGWPMLAQADLFCLPRALRTVLVSLLGQSSRRRGHFLRQRAMYACSRRACGGYGVVRCGSPCRAETRLMNAPSKRANRSRSCATPSLLGSCPNCTLNRIVPPQLPWEPVARAAGGGRRSLVQARVADGLHPPWRSIHPPGEPCDEMPAVAVITCCAPSDGPARHQLSPEQPTAGRATARAATPLTMGQRRRHPSFECVWGTGRSTSVDAGKISPVTERPRASAQPRIQLRC